LAQIVLGHLRLRCMRVRLVESDKQAAHQAQTRTNRRLANKELTKQRTMRLLFKGIALPAAGSMCHFGTN
jgi:hypothetical protein